MPFQDIIIFSIGIFAGGIGALLGIGGGVIVIPFLVLFIRMPIHVAIGTSFLSVLSVSLSAASSYLKNGLCDVETGLSLEAATVPGAILGAFLAGFVEPRFLQISFSILLFYVSGRMLMRKSEADKGKKRETGRWKRESVAQGASFAAGIVSGSLGVGGGIIKVPILHYILDFSMKEAVATSSFMIGITVAASTIIFALRGHVDPYVAGPLIAGIFIGARAGARYMTRVSEKVLRRAFALVLLYFGIRFIIMSLG